MAASELIHFGSETKILTDPTNNRSVVEVMFAATQGIQSRILMDKATAAKLINQLRRSLDDDYNRTINERPVTDPHPEQPSYPIPNY